MRELLLVIVLVALLSYCRPAPAVRGATDGEFEEREVRRRLQGIENPPRWRTFAMSDNYPPGTVFKTFGAWVIHNGPGEGIGITEEALPSPKTDDSPRAEQNFFPKIDLPGLTMNQARLKERGQVATVCEVPYSNPVGPRFLWDGYTTQVFRRGHGPAAREGDSVALRYAAWSGKWHEFESSNERERGQLEYTLPRPGSQTACWLSGVWGMQIGEQRQVTVPFSGPGAVLVYDLELVSIR